MSAAGVATFGRTSTVLQAQASGIASTEANAPVRQAAAGPAEARGKKNAAAASTAMAAMDATIGSVAHADPSRLAFPHAMYACQAAVAARPKAIALGDAASRARAQRAADPMPASAASGGPSPATEDGWNT